MKILKKDSITQGDILIEHVTDLPDGLHDVPPVDGKHIVAHSETGHHHFTDSTVSRLMRGEDPFVCYLVAEGAYADIVHARQTFPHETVRYSGTVRITRQREWTPQGDRMVQD